MGADNVSFFRPTLIAISYTLAMLRNNSFVGSTGKAVAVSLI
jgi:hypothetical protein